LASRRLADIGAAVIGTGFIGTVHVEALRRIGVSVRGVLGSSPVRGAARAEALNVPRAYADLDELLADPLVDVVHVTSPNDLHASQTLAILDAGKHVVCEKPLAMTAGESSALVARAAATGLVNATNFNIRFYPLNQHAHEIVGNGARGAVSISQISPGRKNSLVYEIDGSDGAWSWDSEQPDQAWLGHRDRPNEILIRNPALMGPAGQAASALPGGHVEGFFDTFCAHFRTVYADVGAGAPSSSPGYPTFADGHDEMLVGEAIARSAREGRWVAVDRSGPSAPVAPVTTGAAR
jgi:predicted dehydrogenase